MKNMVEFSNRPRGTLACDQQEFTKGSDTQVGDFVFLEVCITEDITSAYSNLWDFHPRVQGSS